MPRLPVRAIRLSASPVRAFGMINVRLQRGRVLLLCLFIGSHLPMIGCDDSKTSGTIVQESEEAKAFLKSKRESYKPGAAKKKDKAAKKAEIK